MENIEKKNTVSSKGQVKKNIIFEGKENGSLKVLFLGNSITKHSPAPQIGWNGNWGMAATELEKDYVHICEKAITSRHEDASFCIVQGAEWEWKYKAENICDLFEEAHNFRPDVIISFLSENVPEDYIEKDSFIKALHDFHNYLSAGNQDVGIIVVSNFFNNEKKSMYLKEYCEIYNATFVYISDLILDENNLASMYEHEGVRIHPGDLGMKLIAERIIDAFDTINVI